MNLKSFAAILALSFVSVAAFAQDDDDDRPVIRKDRRSNTASSVRSIYAVGLMHVTEDNVGFGLSYEHFIDKDGIVSLYLPISYALSNTSYYSYRYPEYYNYSYQYNLQDVIHTNKGMLNFYPGIKIYPGGSNKKVSYALGTSLVFGIGATEKRVVDYRIDTVISGPYVYHTQNVDKETKQNLARFKMGMLITNYLNIRPGNKYYLGLEFGLGYSYFNSIDGIEDDRSALVQLGLKFGFTK